MPASRPPRRWRPALPAVGIMLAVLAPAVAGCATFDRTFGKQEAVVQFRPQTSNSARLKVRAACSHVPQAIPEPLPTTDGQRCAVPGRPRQRRGPGQAAAVPAEVPVGGGHRIQRAGGQLIVADPALAGHGCSYAQVP